MSTMTDPDLLPRARGRHLALHPNTIEKIFTDRIMDLKEVIVLDGTGILAAKTGFTIL